ncbi:MAG: carbon monoxide dehydrogenase, partial [Thermoleophilia bacterium]
AGEDVVAMSRPFPAAAGSPHPYYAAAHLTARYAGEPLAVVVAKDRYIAEDALELIEVEYEPLPAVVEPEQGEVVSDRSFSYGDVEEAFASCDLVVRERFSFPRWTCCPLETYGVVADWDAVTGTLTAWANFQGPFTLHSVAAAALGLPGSRLRLITPPDSGGSFGIKAAVYVYIVLLGLASRKLGIPVRWTEDRLEHLAGSSASTARITDVEAAFTRQGELIGLRYDVIEDVGAYLRAPEPATLYRMHGSLTGAYRVRNVAARNRVVLTNRCPTALNRGFGGPQLYLALEGIMDIAARRLDLDPAELRRRNLVPSERFPYRTPTGALYDSGDYEACLDQALERARYEARRQEQRRARADGRLYGIGLACVVEPSISNMGYISLVETAQEREHSLPKSGNAEGATVSVSPLGGVTVRVGTTPQGQGHKTVCAQIVAEVLQIDPGEVEVVTELDTSTSAWTVASGNYSSRFSGVGAGAVYVAAQKVAAKVAAIRDHLGDQSLSLRRVAGIAHWHPDALPPGMEPGLYETAFCAAPNLAPPDEEDRVASSAAHGFIVDVAVVEVGRETGEVRVLDYVTVHDAGRLLNPLVAEGQIRGGFAHGAGAALFERLVYDEDGNLLTGTFMDYLCPTAPDLPPLSIEHRETPSPFTPLGAKGLGEGNTMSVPAALANAVADALGKDRVDIPFTPSRVWEAMQG